MREIAWENFLKKTMFGELDIPSARSGSPGKYKEILITKWPTETDPNSGRHTTIEQVAKYLDDEGVLVQEFHPGKEYQGKKWEEVLNSYTHTELSKFPKNVFNRQYIDPDPSRFWSPKRAAALQKSKKKKRSNKRCKECRCKPCKCKEDIHCYQITCDDKKTKKKKKKKKKKKSQEGGYPFWFDDVPKGMSRDQYKRLEGSKPKNKSMKVWIRENKKNMKKYTKNQKGGFLPLCLPCWAGPALAATGLGGAGYMVSKSSSSKTVNGKTVSERKESYEIKKNGKKIKKVYEQKNNKIYLNGTELKPRPKTMKIATKRLNKRIKECVKSGFKKC
jgi:hypothetical protein